MPKRDAVLAYYRKILPFYEKEAAARADRAFWTGLAREWRPGRILEIGSGLGSITSALGRSARAVGIDISLEMLERGARGLSSHSHACFVAADMRDRIFRGVFDLIIAPGDPFSHWTALSDRRKALRAVAGHLSPQGRFVLEGLHRRRRVSRSVRRRVAYDGGLLSIRETWLPISPGSLWRARYAYRDRPAGGPVRGVAASFTARSWEQEKIRSLFASCGLTVQALWGDFDRGPFWRDAPRLLVVAVQTAA